MSARDWFFTIGCTCGIINAIVMTYEWWVGRRRLKKLGQLMAGAIAERKRR